MKSVKCRVVDMSQSMAMVDPYGGSVLSARCSGNQCLVPAVYLLVDDGDWQVRNES